MNDLRSFRRSLCALGLALLCCVVQVQSNSVAGAEVVGAKSTNRLQGADHQSLQQAFEAGRYNETVKRAQEILAGNPNDSLALYYGSSALFRQQQFAKAIDWGERLYSSKYSTSDVKGQAAYIVAYSAVQTRDLKRVERYGESACKARTVEDCFSISAELMRIAYTKSEFAKAADWAADAAAGLNAVKDRSSDAEWLNYIEGNTVAAYSILGRSNYNLQRYEDAVTGFDKVVQISNDNVLKAEALYFKGMSLWRQNQSNPAIEAFAQGSAMGTNRHSKACRKELERLWKSTHNGSLVGLTRFVKAAVQPPS